MSNKKMKRTVNSLATKQLAKMADNRGVNFEADRFDDMAKSLTGLVSSMMVDAKKKVDVGSTAATPDPDAAETTDVSGLAGSLKTQPNNFKLRWSCLKREHSRRPDLRCYDKA